MIEKKRLFCIAYAHSGNATQSAITAGYSAKTAGQAGSRLLKQTDVQAALLSLRTQSEKKMHLTAERIMQEIGTIALFDPAEMYDQETGKLLTVKDMPEHVRRAIASMEVNPSYTKLKMNSKLGAIELAAKIMGLVKPEQNVVPIQIVIRSAPDTVGQLAVTPGSAPLLLEPEW